MAKKIPSISAAQILDLLATKHASDVFVSECKDGPSQGVNHLRMDAWVMPRSWAHMRSIGYEIKVSRQDFNGDDKWHGYLRYCNEFNFVCPQGLIQPQELPDRVGLLWATPNRVWAKKRAVWGETQAQDMLPVYQYVLMCRARIGREFETTNGREYWHRWLATRDADADLGHAVSRRLRQLVTEQVHGVRCKQLELEQRLAGYEKIRMLLREMGVDEDSWWEISRVARERLQGVTPKLNEVSRSLEQLSNLVDRTLHEIKEATCTPTSVSSPSDS